MFCPRCGQQQASEEARFCSRCGLQLDALAEFVESGGQLAARGGAEGLPALTPRQRGTRMGLLIIVAGLIFGVIAMIMTAASEEFSVLLIPAALVFTAGVLRTLYGMLLEDDSARKKAEKRLAREERRDKKRDKLAGARGKHLPPQRSVPASAYTSAGGATGEMAAPPSVTEGTTRLLEEEGRRQ
jgi:zinc-ribbon domain